MSNLGTLILLILVLALVIVIVSIVAYNRRLDRITRGEARGAHNAIPEPGTTVSGVYRIVLMVIIVISYVIIAGMSGRISSMQESINNLQRSQNYLSDQISEMREEMSTSNTRILSQAMEFLDQNPSNNTVKIRYYVDLKEYAKDTKVSLQLNHQSIFLEQDKPGSYSAAFDAALFDHYDGTAVCITEGGKTIVEEADFPEDLVWEAFPVPSISTNSLTSDGSGGKIRSYKGSYSVMVSRPEDLASASLTYMSGGKDLETQDITREVQEGTDISIKKGLDLEQDLTFRIELITKTGYKVIQQTVIIYEVESNLDEENYTEIQDAGGRTLWRLSDN